MFAFHHFFGREIPLQIKSPSDVTQETRKKKWGWALMSFDRWLFLLEDIEGLFIYS